VPLAPFPDNPLAPFPDMVADAVTGGARIERETGGSDRARRIERITEPARSHGGTSRSSMCSICRSRGADGTSRAGTDQDFKTAGSEKNRPSGDPSECKHQRRRHSHTYDCFMDDRGRETGWNVPRENSRITIPNKINPSLNTLRPAKRSATYPRYGHMVRPGGRGRGWEGGRGDTRLGFEIQVHDRKTGGLCGLCGSQWLEMSRNIPEFDSKIS